VQDEPRATTDAAESALALPRFTAPSLQELLALLKEFERSDSAPIQPGSREAGDKAAAQG